MITTAQIKLIHVAKHHTGMTEDEYRSMLSGFGVATSKDLDRFKFDAVMRHFKKMGFKSNRAKNKRSRKPAPDAAPAVSSEQRLKKKIQAMALEMKLTRTYLDAIAKHMFSVDAWTWLSADQLRKLVAALSYHQNRTRKKEAEARQQGSRNQ